MPEQLPTNGFALPITATMPPDAKPGFVVPPLAVAPLAAVPAVVPPSADASLLAAVAALTAALPSTPAAVAPTQSTGTLNVLDPSTIEDPTIRSMAGAFKSLGAGLDFDRIFSKALESGDANLLDMAYLREKAGANADSLAGLAESIVRVISQQADTAQNAVHALAGGAANWNASTAAFNKGAPPEFKLAVQQMLNSGKDAQINAAAKLVVQFAKGQGYVPTPAGLLSTDAAPGAGQALSKADFQSELQKLNPNARDYQAQRGELFVRRALGRTLGQ